MYLKAWFFFCFLGSWKKIEFFQMKNQNLIKVILIREGVDSVLETKKKVYQNYKEFFNFERFHLQHETGQYAKLAKLSALQKDMSLR